MDKNPKFIDATTYKKIYSLVPISCADILVTYKNNFLLGKRVQQPCRGKWCLPGGRIFKNETLQVAAKRKLREEFGINAKLSDLKFLTTQGTMFNDSALGGPVHTINTIFQLQLKSEPKVKLDTRSHSEIKWFSEINKNLHPYIKIVLKQAGF